MDETRPTLFELIAQDQLRDLLQPAVRYILVFYAERYPRYLLRIANRSEELYAAVMAVVEWHFLKQFRGTFTENFYGLERQRAVESTKLTHTSIAAPRILDRIVDLGIRERILAVIFVVGVPYLKAKLDEQWDIHGAPDNLLGVRPQRPVELDPQARMGVKFRHYAKLIFKSSYPTFNALYFTSNLYFNLAYMFGRTNFHKPSLALIRQHMKRLDYGRIQNQAETSTLPALPPNSSLSPLVFLRLLLPSGISALKYLLPLGIFFLKFLEWWQSSDFAAQMARKTSSNIELPPPPAPPALKDAQSMANQRTCRICGKPMINPTAVQTGYVFCYVCIYKWVQETSKCPVTNTKLMNGVDGLRRLII